MTSLNRLVMIVTALSLFGAGCATPVIDGTDHLTLGPIAFETLDADTGTLGGTYDHAGYVITFEAVRGESNPTTENGPRFAIDARLCDERGFCFAMGSGGHGLADPSWSENRMELVPDALQARANHEAAMAFHTELARLDRSLIPGLDEELSALEALSNFDLPSTLQVTPHSE